MMLLLCGVFLSAHAAASPAFATSLFVAFSENYKGHSEIGSALADFFAGLQTELRRASPQKADETSAALDDGKNPNPWPKVFHSKARLLLGATSPSLHTFYDFDNQRMLSVIIPELPQSLVSDLSRDAKVRPENYDTPMKQTIRAFEQAPGMATHGLVDRLDGKLFFPSTATWVLIHPQKMFTFSRKVEVCVTRTSPQIMIPPPNIMDGAKYVGQQDVEGVTCDVFVKGTGPPPFDDQPFLTLYQSTKTGYPVKFKIFNHVEIVIEEFEPNADIDKSYWELPPYCQDKAEAGAGFPISITQ